MHMTHSYMTRNDNEKTIAHNTVRIHYCSGSLLQRYTLILSLAVSTYLCEKKTRNANGKKHCKKHNVMQLHDKKR